MRIIIRVRVKKNSTSFTTRSIRMATVTKHIREKRIRQKINRHLTVRIHIGSRERIRTMETFQVFTNSQNRSLNQTQTRVGKSMCGTSTGRTWRRTGKQQ
jgi:hypothetical protein